MNVREDLKSLLTMINTSAKDFELAKNMNLLLTYLYKNIVVSSTRIQILKKLTSMFYLLPLK